MGKFLAEWVLGAGDFPGVFMVMSGGAVLAGLGAGESVCILKITNTTSISNRID